MPISKEERDKRFKKGQQSARETIAAKEIFSLRLSPKVIESIFEIANEKNIHASDLVRGWIEAGIDSASFEAKPEDRSICMEEVFRKVLREELGIFRTRQPSEPDLISLAAYTYGDLSVAPVPLSLNAEMAINLLGTPDDRILEHHLLAPFAGFVMPPASSGSEEDTVQ